MLDTKFTFKLELFGLVISLLVFALVNNLTYRVSALFIMAFCTADITLYLQPRSIRHTIQRKIFGIFYAALFTGIAIVALFLDKTMCLPFVTILAILLAAYFFDTLSNSKSESNYNFASEYSRLLYWYAAAAVVCFTCYKLFNTDVELSPKLLSAYAPYITITLVAFFIWRLFRASKYIRIGYIATAFVIILCASIYYGVLPAATIWSQYVALLILSILTLPFLAYVCIRNYPNLEGTVDVILIMCIIKAISYFTLQPEISTRLTQLLPI